MIERRTLAAGTAIAGVLAWFGLTARGAAKPKGETFEVNHTDAEWRRLLTPAQYDVLRDAGTEAPGLSALDHQFRNGLYSCVGCQSPLYSSQTKFDSGTGWPSFWRPIDRAVRTTTDTSLFMVRNEVHCARCGGHLGHVFDDGPRPTGLRYCMNGVALSFTAA
ncbi:MAG TPA: peptide-methionine (R)-S-oxide reductase MsrB [Caulobacteraceae bacterium]|jgi:peptide-methionine (R)-S-oxide reductase|nr:peptide-methionine (R)-S-oxide reductase MsrB [Caulobacteraceae bacterium]